ncbi:MAG: hypothetical protein JSS40_18220 [Proteobacteria bacterium]|nr:hypothetical protein [Pseudomonadota bacterium]
MKASDVLAVRCTTPAPVIQIEGQTFAETIAHLGMVAGVIHKALDLVTIANQESHSEELEEAWIALNTIKPAALAVFNEHVRWANEQGLRFTVEKPGAAAGPSQAH